MTESQKQTNNTQQENQVKTYNSLYCNRYYRKHNPELPRSPINGRKYNPKYKWVKLAVTINIGESRTFTNKSDASGLKKALNRIGYTVSVRQTNQGWKVINTGYRQEVK